MAAIEETVVAMNVTKETSVEINVIEETAVEIEVTAEPSLPPVEAKKVKKIAAPKKPRSSPTHPPFLEMITEAIVSLKERTGSSQYAITKFIEENHKNLPSNFRKLLLGHLKKLVASDKLVKVKNSYKLPTKPISSSSNRIAPIGSQSPRAPGRRNPDNTKPKPKAAAAKLSKPKAKTVTKPKSKPIAAKPKPKPKPKSVAAKPKTAGRPKKVAKTAAKASPGKKTRTVTKPLTAAASQVKKAPAAKSVKKPVTVKAPKKKVPTKKGKK